MRVLHLSTWATGGAATAARRLSAALSQRRGVTSKVLYMSSRLPSYLDAAIGKLTRPHNPIFHSYNYLGENITSQVRQFKPDVIHIHWIGAGFIRPEDIPSFDIPIVWTLHDLWPLCGGEHLPNSNRFTVGYLAHNRDREESGLDLDRYTWERKITAFKDCNITFVAPSQYVLAQARASVTLGNHQLVSIPNGLDTTIFAAKKNIPKGKPIILFVAHNPRLDPNKGLADFEKALRALPAKMRVSVEIKVIEGGVRSEAAMAKIYQMATLTVVPSKMETLSFVTMESLACGTPVVAYRVGGIPDLVEHGVNGYLAKPLHIVDLARGIESILESPALARQYGRAGRQKIADEFKIETVAQKYLDLYRKI